MKFYYTTTAGTDKPRLENERSLGGYRSNTVVPNGELNSLFGELSLYSIEKGRDEYIALILKNETGADATDVNIHFEYPTDTYSKLKLAAVDLNVDVDGSNVMENVGNYTTKPYFADFVEAEDVENKVNIGNILNGEEVGIWINRFIFPENIDADKEDLVYKDNPGDRTYKEKELNTEDEIKIKLEWT